MAAPELVEPIIPPDDAGFGVKARHSIFYETQMEYLLRRQQVDRIVLVGQVTEQCILYSALDACVRHIKVASRATPSPRSATTSPTRRCG